MGAQKKEEASSSVHASNPTPMVKAASQTAGAGTSLANLANLATSLVLAILLVRNI